MAKSKSSYKIFVVEDDTWYRNFLNYTLQLNPDYEVHTFENGKDCLDNLHQKPDLITVDYSLPGMNGVELIKKIKDLDESIQLIVISGQEDVGTAVELLKLGVFDYIIKNEDTKPRLLNSVQNGLINVTLKTEITELREDLGKKYDFSKTIIGNSDALKKTFSLIEKAASSKITVSITGETGTGKELVAKAIHYNSERKRNPFVAVNVAAIPKELIESELFGHEKGAFTGADARRIGKFEQAIKGTIFLDEIGELDLNLQAKLLRVLQEREVTRIGSNTAIAIDVRIIVATHKNLAQEVQDGRFREDLYYRLLGLPIHLPPLRDRGNDVIHLAKFFIDEYAGENKTGKITLSNDAQKKLMDYSYPGNIRELKAIIELACVMCDNNLIETKDITYNSEKSINNILSQEMTFDDYSNLIIKFYLDKYDDNVIAVAKKLNIGKSTIYRIMKTDSFQKIYKK
ncbi:MAG: sigma-54-dependent Fis family transcriptional regulator [Bacteroidia bacterium]|jgi:two-component system response regulator AtoC|nr:sigma-54-dependent Fis family transcriptional regulator [Bacteroidia bacterium]